MSNTEYLKQNIVPLLEGAMKNVDVLRPQDPIEYIAYYCLKNHEKI